ncbi:cytochrome c-type biogenesis protein CcmH [Aliiroseovarius halocynthiae]|uniref:C-type cytochrome biogenesis protein CcmI n=1 Tax=Aliiroseovarius halocynthiae TaxID=985055 RepID=A0A545SX07_9RHOB|nr:c-type cytochrome biogenesis protein CcmI [Aliiroseovarius halocynthiae]TQV69497.1 c-type cytochrome biogenesis protein CcmI [Aliiroseovarius halocynthiae]SMR72897.1 cytochrome c-type biogenesis protein CcmH [Aliiroseovarius halocynthiae]
MENLAFWAIVGATTLATILLLARCLLTVPPSDLPDETAMSSDMKVYRDQLAELDRDIDRGILSKDDGDRARVEISRRLLEADKTAQARKAGAETPTGLTRATMGIIAIALVAGSFGLYLTIGVPGAPDFGRAKRIALSEEMRQSRPSQDVAEAQMPVWAGPPQDAPADYLKLVEGLRTAVASRPNDPQGLDLLATHEAAIGNLVAARAAMGQLLDIKGETATANDYARHAELMINAAGGFVSPDAEAMLRRALEVAPNHALARFYTGLMFAQNQRPDLAFRLWRRLLEDGPTDAIWWPAIRDQIGDLAVLAGENYTPPAAPMPPVSGLSGPSDEDIEAASSLSGEERAEMIQSMITRLSDRLATEGGTPEEWARLVSVLGVVGDTQRATAIWAEAQTIFATHPEALETVRAAAKQAGIAQ